MTNGQPISARPPTPWLRALALGAGGALLAPLLLAAFLWPLLSGGPTDVPLAVAGPPEAVEGVAAQLEERVPDGFEVLPVADREAAGEAVTEREAYGAVVLSPQGPPEVLVATSASPAVAGLLTELADGLAASPGGEAPGDEAPGDEAPGDEAPGGEAPGGEAPGGEAPGDEGAGAPGGSVAAAPTVTDLAPPPPGDPAGSGLAAGSLPLVLGGLALGALASSLVVGHLRRLATVLVGALVGGPAATLVLHGWFDALGGDPLVEAGALALGLAAVATPIVGLVAAFGRAGLALGPMLLVLLGNPLSGAQTAPELLPAGWGALGQALPPGALVSLLRSVSGFDGAGGLTPALVLTGWLAGGLLLIAVGAVRERASGARSPATDDLPPSAPPPSSGAGTAPPAAVGPARTAP